MPRGCRSEARPPPMCEHYAGIACCYHLSLFTVAQWLSGKPLTNYWCKWNQLLQDALPLSAHSIPGPIEVADEVLFANAHPSMSHVSPEFVPVFGDCIRMIRYASSASLHHHTDLPSSSREVLFTKDAQPFLISGSGTLGWDQVSPYLAFPFPRSQKSPQVSANLVEPGENALVLHTGYFGDSFADWCVF